MLSVSVCNLCFSEY